MGIAFVVEFYDASNPTKDLKALLNNRSYIQTFERDISLNGFNGKQYRRNWKDIYTCIQYFTGKKRIYVVQVIARDEKNGAVTQFLSSLKLGAKVGDVQDPLPDDTSFLPTVSSDNRVFMPNDVTRKAIPVWKPEPTYSAEGLKKNVKGTVLLQVVISPIGEVNGATILKGLGHGLDDKAIEVAKTTLFIPAEKDGHAVSQYIKLEYNFDTGR
jgi:TonB family protein